eukprot:COSAG06_NODE_36010_length_452_cov_101.419263_1_plen_50_part_10
MNLFLRSLDPIPSGPVTILHRISSAPEPDRTSAFVARRHEMVVPVCIQLP